MTWRVFRRLVAASVLVSIGVVAFGYIQATANPLVRRASVKVRDWPADARPVTVLLISDVHIAGPDMPPERVRRIAARLNSLKPDLVLIAGDLISQKSLASKLYSPSQVVQALGVFKARLGVVAVLGNHDHWAGTRDFRRAFAGSGITLLENSAVKRGPLVIGGVDDEFTGNADIAATYRAMQALKGPRLVLTHDADIVPALPSRVVAVLGGHTHCGQIVKPWSGEPIANVSRFGMQLQCGQIDYDGQRVFITAGLGTSVVWLRYGAPPDVWLITLGR